MLFSIHGNSKKNEFESHFQWVLSLSLSRVTYFWWVLGLSFELSNSFSVSFELKLNTQTHFFLSTHVCYFQTKMFLIILNHEILWYAYLICIPIRSASHPYHIDTHQIISAYQKWYTDQIRMYLEVAATRSSRLWNFFKNNCFTQIWFYTLNFFI